LGEDTVYVLRGGMGQVTARLADALDVVCEAQVTAIRRVGPGSCAVSYSKAGETHEVEADMVVCAVQGEYAKSLIADPTAEERQLLAAVRYNSLGVVHYSLCGQSEATLEFALKKRHTRIATWQLSAAQAVDGEARSVLYCQLTPEAVQEAIAQGCTDNIDQLLRDEVRSRIPDFDSRLLYTFNQWIACKLPVFYPGYGKTVDTFLRWQSAAPRQIYYCGDYLAQSLVNGACHSAMGVVQAIVTQGNRQ
jgi:oxygen-dependent protoporphyrinogen oxidase